MLKGSPESEFVCCGQKCLHSWLNIYQKRADSSFIDWPEKSKTTNQPYESYNLFKGIKDYADIGQITVMFCFGGGRVVRRCWVNFQCRGVLLIWICVGQGPSALAVGAGGGCLDIFSLIYHFSFLSPSLTVPTWP